MLAGYLRHKVQGRVRVSIIIARANIFKKKIKKNPVGGSITARVVPVSGQRSFSKNLVQHDQLTTRTL